MKTCYAIIFLFLFSLSNQAQSVKLDSLRYIDDYPIKIDGGCSFFNHTNIPLEQNKYQLIISVPKVAFIQYSAYSFAYFKQVKRVKTKKGYMDYYKGKDGSFVLAIDSIVKINDKSSIRSGTLEMNVKGLKERISKVHGLVEEADSYNGHVKMRKQKKPLH